MPLRLQLNWIRIFRLLWQIKRSMYWFLQRILPLRIRPHWQSMRRSLESRWDMSSPCEPHFPVCQFCGKPQLPPGILVIAYGTTSEPQYCEGHDERVCCPHCGSMVHIRMHPFRACEYFHRFYDPHPLRVDKVLEEAEAILKRGRRDE